MALRISRTVFSALSGTRLLACLIVAPHWATMSQKSSLAQLPHSVRQVLTAYKIATEVLLRLPYSCRMMFGL